MYATTPGMDTTASLPYCFDSFFWRCCAPQVPCTLYVQVLGEHVQELYFHLLSVWAVRGQRAGWKEIRNNTIPIGESLRKDREAEAVMIAVNSIL